MFTDVSTFPALAFAAADPSFIVKLYGVVSKGQLILVEYGDDRKRKFKRFSKIS